MVDEPEDDAEDSAEEQPTKEHVLDDVKSFVAVGGIALILFLIIRGNFDLSLFFIIISLMVAVFSLNLEKPASMLFLFTAFLFAAFARLNFMESSGTWYFLMLVSAIASHMDLDNGIILLLTAAISIYTFGYGVLGFIVMIVVALFIYAAKTEAIFGVVMIVPLLMVGWFVSSGWADRAEQTLSGISTQLESSTGISTGGMGDQIKSALNNTWLLLTNPNDWYEKQYATEGKRDEGLSSAALEVTKIEALPASVMPLDTFDVVFELENKGTKEAKDIRIGSKGDTFADACGKFGGNYCNPSCGTESDVYVGCASEKTIGKISPQERGFDTFTFQAPECPGTYSVGAAVRYNYSVETTMNLQMISRDYYNDLLRNNRMKWSDELSVASAGPFKMSLRTNPTQPIPDNASDGSQQVFKVYLGLVNEKQGKATMKSAIIRLPKDLELVGWDSVNARADPDCSITYDVRMDVALVESKKYLAEQVKSATDKKLAFAKDEVAYKSAESAYRAEAMKIADAAGSDYLTYRTYDPTPERKFSQNEWRYYKCSFRRVSTAPKIDQIQTFFMRAELPYTFEYDKQTTVNVRSVGGMIPPHCKKSLAAVSPISPTIAVPQKREAIADTIAKEIFYCYNKNNGWWWSDQISCGEWRIDIEGCSGSSITNWYLAELVGKIKDAQGRTALENNIYVNEYDASGKEVPIADLKGTNAGNIKELFTDGFVYKINMFYTRDPIGGAHQDIYITSKTPDAKCPVAPVVSNPSGPASPTTPSGTPATPASCQTDASCGGLLCLHDPMNLAGVGCQCTTTAQQQQWVPCSQSMNGVAP